MSTKKLQIIGGMNADTLDGMHASEFAVASDVTVLQGLVGDTAVAEQINTALAEILQPDWSQTDETAPDYIKNKPNELDALNILIEAGLVSPVVTASNELLLDKNGNLFTL